MTPSEIVVAGLLVLMVVGGILTVWLMASIVPKPCCKCGSPGRIVHEKSGKWFCWDHMREDP